MIRLILLGIFMALPAAAQTYDGRYQLNACTAGPSDSQIQVIGNEIRFWESVCILTNPVAIRDMDNAFLFDAICEGEGEHWTLRMFVMRRADGGLSMVRRGYAYSYQRCG